MKRASGSLRKAISFRKYTWRSLFTIGLVLLTLTAVFSPDSAPTAFALAASHLATGYVGGTFSSSPSQGPVGAVIVVNGSGVNLPDGTQVDFGYIADFPTCTAATDSQPGVVHDGAFSGWFRWPSGTGTGTFMLCAAAAGSNQPFFLRGASYDVLSASAPHVSLAPATLDAGKQATVSGTNFLPGGTRVNLAWKAPGGGQSISLGSVASDETGAFTQTFTVPSKSSTGTYTLVATAGSGQPPTLSASTSVPVNGITIVAVPTPTAQPSPTAVPTTPAATATATRTNVQTNPAKNAAPTGTANSGLLLVIALIGLLLIIAALAAGVLVVRRQRNLAVNAASGGPTSWHATTDMLASTPTMPGTTYPPGSLPLATHAGPDSVTVPRGLATPADGLSKGVIPFDPGLAEAMREAQVSLFATPRPPVAEAVHS
ncbi:MAG TPA: hypothetical protein VKV19_01165 [Ktedonobacteraceae bacterium]|nr:hypothetical protein [Ktedonobacteraceae bacterium]